MNIRSLLRPFSPLLLFTLIFTACATPTLTATSFRSEANHLEVTVPGGWAAYEEEEYLADPFTGIVAFNSWGEQGFWVKEMVVRESEDTTSYTYSPQTVLAQIPQDGAYIVLVWQSGGPPIEEYGPEYESQDLSGLWDENDCREKPGDNGASIINFFKWGRLLSLEVYCGPQVSGETATSVNALLASWQFDAAPAGDLGWATVMARKLLPQSQDASRFPILHEGHTISFLRNEDVVYATQAEVLDKTVLVTFRYIWDVPLGGEINPEDCPTYRCHWWRIEARPDGEMVLVEEGGASLPEAALPTDETLPLDLPVCAPENPAPVSQDLPGKLAFLQNGDIWVKILPDGEPLRLTTDGANLKPRWSPSGEWLAFRKGRGSVWVARADGSEIHPLEEERVVDDFAWSPVEDRLAYITEHGELRQVNADGSGFINLGSWGDAERVIQLQWSPDGVWIAIVQLPSLPGTPMRVLKVQGVIPEDVINIYPLYQEPATLAGWTQDGSALLIWESNVNLSASLMADGASLSMLFANGEETQPLGISTLAYEDFVRPGPLERQFAVVVGNGRQTWANKSLLAFQNSEGMSLTPPEWAVSSPAWSQDGGFLAFVSMPAADPGLGGEPLRQALMKRHLQMYDFRKKQICQLTFDDNYRDEYPLWATRGDTVLFARIDNENHAALWATPLIGGEPWLVVGGLGLPFGWFGYYGHIEWNLVFDWWQ